MDFDCQLPLPRRLQPPEGSRLPIKARPATQAVARLYGTFVGAAVATCGAEPDDRDGADGAPHVGTRKDASNQTAKTLTHILTLLPVIAMRSNSTALPSMG